MREAGAPFPNVAARVTSACIHFIGSCVLAWCLSRRIALEDLNNLQGWRNLSFARLLIILIFVDSLAFLLFTGILIHGVGLELSRTSCEMGILACIGVCKLRVTTTEFQECLISSNPDSAVHHLEDPHLHISHRKSVDSMGAHRRLPAWSGSNHEQPE